MSTWTRRFSDGQREAILHAVLTDGMSARAAARAAAAGELPDMAAFRMAPSTAAELIRRERDNYRLRDPETAAATLADDAVKLARFAHQATTAIEAATGRGETPDPIAVKRAAEAVTAARRALGPQPAKPVPKPDTSPQDVEPDHPEDGNGVVASLLAKVPANGNGSTAEPQPA